MKVIEILNFYQAQGYYFSVNQHGTNTMLITHNHMSNKGQSILINLIDSDGCTIKINSIKQILKSEIKDTYIRTNYSDNNVHYIKPTYQQFTDILENETYCSFKDIIKNL